MQVKEFQTVIEKTNLIFSEPVENAIVLIGKSKKSSTSVWHLLSGKKLKGAQKNCEETVQVLDASMNQPKISTSSQTETLFPNVCYIQVKNTKSKICLIDSPCYDNTRGSLGILSSGYAHYRIFQTCKNLKFILCFDQTDLQRTGRQFIESIAQFLNFFKDVKGVRDSIVNHCAFLFSRVSKQINVKIKLLNLACELKTQLSNRDQELIKEFITKIVLNDKVFCIKKAAVGEVLQSTSMLDEINIKIQKWWSRGQSTQPSHEKMFSKIDMSAINTSLLKALQSSCISGQKSRKSYNKLITHYDEWINKIFVYPCLSYYSVASLLNLLTKDFMNRSDDCGIFSIMKKFIQQENFQNSEQTLGASLYKVKINKINKIYDLKPSFCYNPQVKTMRKTVKQFQALSIIEQHCHKLSSKQPPQNKVHEFGFLLEFLYQIFKEIYTVASEFKEDTLVKTYFYEIFCKIQELRFISMILNENSDDFEVLNQICKSNNTPFGIMTIFKDSFADIYFYEDVNYSSHQLLELYLERLNLDQIEGEGFVIEEYFVEAMFNPRVFTNDKCKKSLITLIERYSDMVVQRMKLEQRNSADKYPVIYTDSLKKQLFEELFMAREWAIKLHQTSNDAQKMFFTTSIKRMTSNLASFFLQKGEHNFAKSLYDSVNMVSAVCQTYKRQIKVTQNDETIPRSQIFKLKDLFMNYLASHFRIEEAIELLNDMISDILLPTEKLNEFSQKLLKMRTLQNDSQCKNDYQQKLSQKQYFCPDNEKIKKSFDDLKKCQFF